MAPTPNNPNNPNGGNLQDSIDKLVDVITQDMENRRKRDRKERGRKSQERKEEKLEKAVNDLTTKLGSMGESLSNFMKPIESFQANIRSLALAFDNETKMTMSGSLPIQTRMTATLAMLNNGLGDNQQALGKFVSRSSALNENINLLVTSFREMKNSLGLTTEELNVLGEDIAHSAVTYNVATDRLAKSIADLSKRIAILGFTQANNSFAALREATARTEMAVPGGLAQILGPMLSGGMESLASSQMLGMQGLLTDLVNNQVTSSDQIFKSLENAVTKIDQRLRGLSGQGPQVLNQILKDNYGISFEQYNLLKSINEAAGRNPTALEKIQASVEQAETALTQMLPALKEPIVELAATVGDFFTSYPGLYKGLIQVLTVGGIAFIISKGVLSIIATMKSIAIMRRLSDPTRILSVGLRMLPLIAGGVAAIALTAGALFSSSQDTAEAVTEMNSREKQKEVGGPVDVRQETRALSVLSLGNILNRIQRGFSSGGDPDMYDQNLILVDILRELRQSNGTLSNLGQSQPTLGGESPYRRGP